MEAIRSSETSVLIRATRRQLPEDDNHQCQFYFEAFILLAVSDGFINVSLASNQVRPPRLPELMSPEERRQITYDGLQTRRTLVALETVARRSSHVNQQPYVELRDLLDTMSSDVVKTSQATWLYICSPIIISPHLKILAKTYDLTYPESLSIC
jgi:hypothetical protein